MTEEEGKELLAQLKEIVKKNVLNTSTLQEAEDLAFDLFVTIRNWNIKIANRCEFCYGVLNCESDHK